MESLGQVMEILDAESSLKGWIDCVTSATQSIRVGFYTADLESVFVGLIEARGRGVAVTVLGDAATTRRNKNTTSQLQLLASRGARVGLTQGRLLTERYARASPGSWIEGKRGIFHGKVLIADRRMILGSCNYTTSSLCNVEWGVMLELSDKGLEDATSRFDQELQLAEAL